VAVPALSYASTLMTETIAYPFATLCFFLIVTGLSTRSRGWLGAAAAAAILAPLVRKELAVIPAGFAVAALAFYALPWLDRSRRRWAWAIGGALSALAVLAWALTFVSTTWSDAAGHPIKMVAYARSGAGSVVVGLGILPAIAGLAALVRPRGERSTPPRRAFVCLFVAVAAGLLLYTAAKGVYFGPLANPVEERNLIYLVPLVFAGTAMWLSRRRVEPAALLAAAAVVAWLVATVPLTSSPIPASDAPSLEVLHSIGWDSGALHGLLVGITVLAALVALARLRWVVGAAAVLVLAWGLSSETYASRRSADYASALAASIPRPLEWITHATGGTPSLYVGQEILQPTDIWLLSFWNPSLVQLRSLDGTPGGSGPLKSYKGIPATGDILRISPGRDGTLPVDPRLRFLVADQGVTGVGRSLARGERWRVYGLGSPARLHSTAVGVYSDGWMGARSTFSVFNGDVSAVGVRLSRKAWPTSCDIDLAGRSRISVNGSVRAYTIVHACRTAEVSVPTPPPPFKVAVEINPTFVPHRLNPAFPDTRRLGAVVTYSPASGE
jgi:hypothetical protein